MRWAIIDDATGLVANIIIWDGNEEAYPIEAGFHAVQLVEGQWASIGEPLGEVPA